MAFGFLFGVLGGLVMLFLGFGLFCKEQGKRGLRFLFPALKYRTYPNLLGAQVALEISQWLPLLFLQLRLGIGVCLCRSSFA